MTKTSTAPKSVKKSANKSVQKKVKKATAAAVKKSMKQVTKEAPKTVKAAVEKRTTRYIRSIPKAIPAGKIVCHNGAMPETPVQPPGMNGFRVWLDDEAKSDEYGPCNCGWGGLPHHMPLGWLECRQEYDARKFPRR